MKKFIMLTLGLTFLLLWPSCDRAKNPYKSPKSIAKVFAESLYTGHFEEAKTYVTPESVPIINFFKHAFPPEHFAGCEHVTLDEITVKQTSDSTATCKYIIHLCNGKCGNENTKVVKRDGKWYVTLREGKTEKRNIELRSVE